MAVRAARAETRAEKSEALLERMRAAAAERDSQGAAPVSAVNIREDGQELIDAALQDELNADDARPQRAPWRPGFSKG